MSFWDKIGDFFSGGKNPATGAMKELNQIPGQIKPLYDPYVQQGQQAHSTMSPTLEQMTQDPAAYLEFIMNSYQPSQGYNLRKDEALKAASNSAAAGGVAGTYGDARDQSRITDALLGEDMQQYINNILGINKTGLEGEQNFYNTGFNASNAEASDLANLGGTKATLAFNGQQQKNAGQQALFKAITEAMGGVAGLKTFGGGSVGGDIISKWI